MGAVGPGVSVVADWRVLRELAPEWDELAREAAEPNVFHESWMLLPALEHLLAKAEGPGPIRIVAVRRASGELIGLIPLEIRPRYKGLPFAHLRLWQHLHCYLCTPLLHRSGISEALEAFHDWLADARGFPKLMVWNGIGGDGPVADSLRGLARARGFELREEGFERAILLKRPGVDAETHIEAVLSGGHRRDLRRLEKRLGELGNFAYDQLAPGSGPQAADAVDRWIGEFLELEKKGWKGRAGTALACRETDRAFFSDCVRAAFERGKLRTLEARLDGKAIASRLNFHSGSGGMAFSFKIAFDEAYARYRPGLLLEVRHIHELHGQPLEGVDYCADPGHPMLDRLSEDRRRISTLTVATRAFPERRLLLLLSQLEPFFRRLSDRLRSWKARWDDKRRLRRKSA